MTAARTKAKRADLTIGVHGFHAPQPGPALLVFGAVHGWETCGTQAILKLIGELESGKVALQKGSVTFVPVANPLAYAQGVRYVKENLNRIFRPAARPASDEARFANVLCRLMERCDAFLDIHSTTGKGKPFLYLDYPTPRNRAWASILRADHAIVGWPELYERMGRSEESYGTIGYANSLGKDNLLIECGQHKAPSAPRVAYNAIIDSMRHYGLIAGKAQKHAVKALSMQAGYFRADARDRFARDWRHLDLVRKGDALIVTHKGEVLKAPHDAHIIMPKASAPAGDDWLYLGKTVKI